MKIDLVEKPVANHFAVLVGQLRASEIEALHVSNHSNTPEYDGDLVQVRREANSRERLQSSINPSSSMGYQNYEYHGGKKPTLNHTRHLTFNKHEAYSSHPSLSSADQRLAGHSRLRSATLWLRHANARWI
jgi:hypothetical protein